MQAGLQLRVSQHLALTPQLQQSIRLLQLSSVELEQEIETMLADNPLLERDDSDDFDGGSEGSEGGNAIDLIATRADRTGVEGQNTAESAVSGDGEFDGQAAEGADSRTPEDYSPSDWEGDGALDSAHGDDPWASAPASLGQGADDEAEDWGARTSAEVSLSAHLHQQALALRLQDGERAALFLLIDSLDERGYLADSLDELAQALCPAQDPALQEAAGADLAVALALLQHFDPVGVGARHVGECLQLQLRALQGQQPPRLLEVAQRLCVQPLELLARRDTKRLATLCAASEEEVRAALALIVRLEPCPARRFAPVQDYALVPDVLVTARGAGFAVQINPAIVPRLRVHEVYAQALRGQRGHAGAGALQQRLQEARWFIKNVQQRFETLLRVSEAIVQRQKSFFTHGALAMRPLVLREIADELGLHESTISRVTTAKYMATPHGTVELKFFFGSALETQTGGSASSTAVRALIKQLVAAESPAKPLSDQKIAELLQDQGIECARRTVAKYREALKIPPASLRKGQAG